MIQRRNANRCLIVHLDLQQTPFFEHHEKRVIWRGLDGRMEETILPFMILSFSFFADKIGRIE